MKAGAGYDCACGQRPAEAEIPPGEWACQQCGAAYFGTPPGHGLCPTGHAYKSGQ